MSLRGFAASSPTGSAPAAFRFRMCSVTIQRSHELRAHVHVLVCYVVGERVQLCIGDRASRTRRRHALGAASHGAGTLPRVPFLWKVHGRSRRARKRSGVRAVLRQCQCRVVPSCRMH
eukprot:2230994-Rhodomonas_salina.1